MAERCPCCRRLTRRAVRKEPTRVNGTTRAEEKATRKEREKAETAELRRFVFERAQEKCELCRFYPPSELHHLEGGSGRRREKQGPGNTLAVCKFCHRRWHREGAFVFAWDLLAWSSRHGIEVPRNVTRRWA